MKAVTFTAKGRVTIEFEPIPDCTADTLLLRTLYSGVTNGSERNKLLGGNYSRGFPARVGYQRVAEVIACGCQITRFNPGDIVFSGTKHGHVEFDLAREEDLIVTLSQGFDCESGSLLGIAAVALHDVRRANCGMGDRVLVLGAGPIGLLAAQAALLVGAQVTIADVLSDRLQVAQTLGVSSTVQASTSTDVAALATNAPYSLVLECSGADILDAVIGRTRGEGLLLPFGRLVLVAGRDRVSYDFNAAQHKEIAVYHADHFTRNELVETVQLVVEGKLRVRPLIRDVVPIDDAPQFYARLVSSPQSVLGTVFRW